MLLTVQDVISKLCFVTNETHGSKDYFKHLFLKDMNCSKHYF